MAVFLRKYNTALSGATLIRIPVVKRGVVDFAVSADWTPASGDVKVSKDGGAPANIGTLPTAVAMGNTAYWEFTLTGAELSAKSVLVTVADSATKAVEDQAFAVETYGDASAMYAADLSAAGLPANLTQYLGNAVPAADASGYPKVTIKSGTGTGEVSLSAGTVTLTDASLTAAKIASDAFTAAKFAADCLTADKIANGAIDAATFAADVDSEILSYLVDDATRLDGSALNNLSSHDPGETIMGATDLGTGVGLTSLAPAATALSTAQWTNALAMNLGTLASHDPGATLGTSTLTQTQVTGGAYSMQNASCVLGDTRIAYLDGAITSRMASYTQPTGFLGATFPTDPADQSLIIAATDALLAAINALNNLSSAQAQSAAAAALVAYDPPTNAEMEARTLATASYATASALSTVASNVATLLTRIPETLFSGITSLAQWLGLLAGKQVGNSTARTEMRATGAGAGSYDETTDSLQAIKDAGVSVNVDEEAIADAVVDALGGAAEITVLSPVLTGGIVEIQIGDSYHAAEDRALVFDSEDWPDLTGATEILFVVVRTTSPYATVLSVDGDASNEGQATQTITVELETTDTAGLSRGTYDWKIVATLVSGEIATIGRGTCRVKGEA